VFQGEREMASDNMTIGRFHLFDIPPSPRGVPQIEVTFDIDANGMLNVSAQDKATGKEQSIKIEASSGISESEIEKMINDSKKNEQKDKEKREQVDVVNQSEHMIYETEKNIKENDDKLNDDDKSQLNEKLDTMKKAKETGNTSDMKKALEELNQAWSKVAGKMYEGASQSAQEKSEASTEAKKGKNKDEIQDADFEVVD
jgi:Molecular chaperone